MRFAILGLVVLLAAAPSWSANVVICEDYDWYPLFESNRLLVVERDGDVELRLGRLAFLAGAIELVRRPQWFKLRLPPLIYQHGRNQRHLSPVLLSTVVYQNILGTELPIRLGRLNSDFSRATFLSWRTESKDSYLSGGFSALFGQVLGNYGFAYKEGTRLRACKLTPLLFSSRAEDGENKINSLWGWIFSADWNKSEDKKSWRFSLFQRCFAVGRRDDAMYGRLLWIPIGDAPPFLRNLFKGPETKTPSDSDETGTRNRISL